ncbi:MAG: DUF4416 family protein [Planctomycetota bacterium]
MGEPILRQRVTPFVAMLAADLGHFDAAQGPLEELLGPVEFRSPCYPFNPTDYYTPTMGANLKRCFFSFHNFADPSTMPDWKLATNAMEEKLAPILAPSGTPPRPINIDPGYVTGAKLVLATTKDFAHRIYMRDGIFAEITMAFRRGVWLSHQFTFPDFKCGTYDSFLRRMRDNHLHKSRTSPKDM